MRLLVLGASGFIGRHVWRTAAERGIPAIGTQSRSHEPHLVTLDLARDRIRDQVAEGWFTAGDPVWVVHAISPGSPDLYVREREATRAVVVTGLRQLVEDLAPFPVRHLYLSTSYVFDGATGRYREQDPCRPICEYGRQKLEAERIITAESPHSIVLRLDKIVGDRPQERHLFAEWTRRLRGGQAIPCLRSQTMAPVLVDDVARMVLALCRLACEGLFHVSGLEPIERRTLAEQFLKATALPGAILDVEALPFADPRPLHSDLDGGAIWERANVPVTPVQQILESFASNLRRESSSPAP